MKINLKRGYLVDVEEERENVNGIDVIGNYSKSNYQATVIVNKNGIAPTVRENHGQVTGIVMKEEKVNNLRIRKLTPKECWRLMGFDDSDFEKAEKVNSNTQLYKQAGNSIVVNVLERILENLLDKDEHIKILELFGGIGACSKALERIGINYEIADYVEIDKYAVKSFNAIHDTNFEPQDICKWDKNIECDLIMHGSPCQDFSLAGKQAGGDEGSGTRSSLMYETIRIVEKLKPKYVIWENVKNVISKKHRHNFDNYLNKMEELGYTNYYQVLNAKDYGIPQNRERVFTISILGNKDYDFPSGEKCDNMINRKYGLYNQVTRWGIYDKNGLAPTITASMGMGGGHVPMIENFEFPLKQELKLKLKDMLEDNVDEKYYLSDKMVEYVSATGTANFKNPDSKINLDIARPLTADPNKRAGTTNYLSNDLPDNCDLNKVINVGNVNPSGKGQNGTVVDSNGLARTITIEKGEGQKILIKNATKQGYLEAYPGDGVDISSRMQYHRGNVQPQSIQTITTSGGNDRGVVIENKFPDLD